MCVKKKEDSQFYKSGINIESGEYNPTLEMLVKLATAMDLDILVTLKPKNNNDTECDNDVTSSPPTL